MLSYLYKIPKEKILVVMFKDKNVFLPLSF